MNPKWDIANIRKGLGVSQIDYLPIGKGVIDLTSHQGKMTLTFLIYYIGRKYQHGQGRKSHHYVYAEAGSVLEIHELGFNSRPRLPRNAKKK